MGLNRLNDSQLVEIQGRRPMPSNCSKCLSKAKALFSLRDLMMEKLVQSVKLKFLSVYCLKIVKAASSIEGVIEVGVLKMHL